jgi:hypothetical protein
MKGFRADQVETKKKRLIKELHVNTNSFSYILAFLNYQSSKHSHNHTTVCMMLTKCSRRLCLHYTSFENMMLKIMIFQGLSTFKAKIA